MDCESYVLSVLSTSTVFSLNCQQTNKWWHPSHSSLDYFSRAISFLICYFFSSFTVPYRMISRIEPRSKMFKFSLIWHNFCWFYNIPMYILYHSVKFRIIYSAWTVKRRHRERVKKTSVKYIQMNISRNRALSKTNLSHSLKFVCIGLIDSGLLWLISY